jgi:hypothetical protein
MSLLHSAADAALLEAARFSNQLISRYVEALEHLVRNSALSNLLEQRIEELEAQIGVLEDMVRARDLIPHESDTELQDWRRLLDQVTGQLDTDQAARLSGRFVEQEKALLDELDQAAEEVDLAAGLANWQKAGAAAIARLSELAD